MPSFRNTSGSMMSVVYNGRKIKIDRGQVIEGPPHFKLYKGLVLVDDSQIPVPAKGSKLRTIVSQSVVPTGEGNKKNVDRTIDFIKNYKTSDLPSVGICILTKNHLSLIKECCESIFHNIFYKNTKLYIFDTGSTEEAVWNYYKTLEGRRIPIHIVKMNYFHFSRNYNEGIKHVDTDYVVIQNNDTVVINDYVSRLMKTVIISKVGAAGPRMLYKNDTIQHDGQTIFTSDGSLAHPGHVNLGKPKTTPTGRHSVDGITGAALFIKTQLYRDLGGFDERFKDIYQDVLFNIRLKSLGYSNICDRDAQIYHYDNTSRKELWHIRDEAIKMNQDSDYLYNDLLVSNMILRNAGKPKNIDFSIITLVHNKEQYLNFLEDIKNQKFSGSFEIVALPNFNGEYKGCSEALNIGKDVALGNYCIYCHQDLRVPQNWLESIQSHIKELDMARVGFLGMSGASKPDDSPNSNSMGASYIDELIDISPNQKDTLANLFRKSYGRRLEVQTLDELCLISRRGNSLRFDEESFDHYHWYGADICLQALKSGLKNYAIDAECKHLSDGLNNFRNPDHVKEFVNGASRLFKKWKSKFPHFRSTTTGFSVPLGQIQILFSQQLKQKYNIDVPSIINIS